GGVFVPVGDADDAVGDVGVLECGNNLHGGAFHLSNALVKALEDGVINDAEGEQIKREAYLLQKRIVELLILADKFTAE
ncbi:MAG: hypothetical protein ACPGUY_06395, partial [Akkermansiaceae bacterium]